MSAHFRWYGSDSEVTVPFNARYSYPSQANKTTKTTPRIQSRNGVDYNPGSEIRIDLPAQGYLNPGNSTLVFDVSLLYTVGTNDSSIIRFQNNIQSIFSRVRMMYGSTPLEDITDYNLLVRALTEWTATGQSATIDQLSISEGIGSRTFGASGDYPFDTAAGYDARPGIVNARQAYIHGLSMQNGRSSLRSVPVGSGEDQKAFDSVNAWTGSGFGMVPSGQLQSGGPVPEDVSLAGKSLEITRRYAVQLNLGLFQQGKLIPLKYMASQLSMVINLATAEECIFVQPSEQLVAEKTWTVNPSASVPSYKVSNVVFIPEILEFDSSYDETFLRGLQNGGVPIKFASFNSTSTSVTGGTSQTISISERNRSIKAIFTVQVRRPVSISADSGAMFYTSSLNVASTLQEFQYRIGGRYFPASPVQCSTQVGGSISNSGTEAYTELSKALNIIGDYRLSTTLNTLNWAQSRAVLRGLADSADIDVLPEYDTKYAVVSHKPDGTLNVFEAESARGEGGVGPADVDTYYGRSFAGNYGTAAFAAAIDLETSSGMEISGLNAEEQSDISLMLRWSAPQTLGFSLITFTYYDAMIVLHENNVMELIK